MAVSYRLTCCEKGTTLDTDSQCLHAWRLTDPREDKARILSSKDPLLEGSCTWIFHDQAFTEWWNDDESRILWIHGDPGKGKTMMMMVLIEEISQRLQTTPGSGVMSYFFCQNAFQELNNTVAILRGLIYLLATHHPPLTRHLRKKLDEAGDRLFEGFNALYGLWNTLSEIVNDPSFPRVYLLIDALDECDNKSLENFLSLLSQERSASRKIKWVVTSRNERIIREILHLGHNTSLELNSSHVSQAVKSFINFKVDGLAARKGYRDELQISVRQYLNEYADGTFLWVALVCKELEKVEAWKTQRVLKRFPGGLEPLYQRMMEQLKDDRDTENVELRKKLLFTVTLAYRPLHLDEIGVISNLPADISNDAHAVQDLTASCGSFLTVREQTVTFVHQSARDYFTIGNGSKMFPLEQMQMHHQLARRLLRFMSETLRRDICGLQRPGTVLSEVGSGLVSRYIPLHIQYACCYWVHHLQMSDSTLCDNDEFHEFLREHLLHWLEALSLTGKMSEGILAITSLESYIPADKSPNLHAFIHDAKRFALYNRAVIEQAPLQVYCSALVFAPERSIVRQRFEEQIPRWICKTSKVEPNWRSALQTLEGHSGGVNAVAFSPDDKMIASASEDETVRLWDSATGVALQTLEGHSGGVNVVAFSPDGKMVASASHDKTVRLWDSAMGIALQTLEGHSGWVGAMAFSPDGKMLASASHDKTVRLWDSARGTALQTLEGHSGWVNAIAFSPDGKMVASASDDKTVRLWNSATEVAPLTLEGHSRRVNAVVFSPDSKMVASASDDETVRLWDSATGTALQTLEGHSGWVGAVVFSPDGKMVASVSDDRTVRLWDSAMGMALQTLVGHSDWVDAVVFSPDGKMVASASHDKTVRLWDSATGTALQTLEGHSGEVNAVAFSPDGKMVVSASEDETVRLWDSATEAALHTLEGHSGWVNAVVFSLDGKMVASASDDETVRLWDSAKGTAIQTLVGHSDWVGAVVFSSDGKMVASASGDKTVMLWDSAMGTALQTLEGHSDWADAVVFSSDGKMVASASHDKTVMLWDSATGTALQTLEGHSGSVNTVVFSPDSKMVASASHDKTIRLWDSATGMALRTLEGHSGGVSTVAFSPDGKMVASASVDETVRLWDSAMGLALQTPKADVTVQYLSFSGDGQYLDSDRGQLAIGRLFLSSTSSQSKFAKGRARRIYVNGAWVFEGMKKVLWLPPDYRAACTAVRNNILAIGHASGRVSILEFGEAEYTL